MPRYEFMCEKLSQTVRIDYDLLCVGEPDVKCPKCQGTRSCRNSMASWRRRRRRGEQSDWPAARGWTPTDESPA
jgi:hypothetical protein